MGLFLNITLYIVVILPEDGQNWSKHAVYVRNKRISEHLWCISQVTIEDIN
jgi:hypothetical protein